MGAFEEFERCLRRAMPHLYDLNYQPPEFLFTVMGCRPEQGIEAVQAVVHQAIEDLKPESDMPSKARIWRTYKVLSFRYIQGLTQDETAQHLGITARQVRREQQQAVEGLARHLWGQYHTKKVTGGNRVKTEEKDLDTQSPTWRSQLEKDLAALQQQ